MPIGDQRDGAVVPLKQVWVEDSPHRFLEISGHFAARFIDVVENLDKDLQASLRVGLLDQVLFDTAVATFVFCSVPDPVLGLRELKRVVKPGGLVILLEHMRSPNTFIGKVMDILNPLVVRVMGANVNRHTVENVQKAGWTIEQADDLSLGGIVKLILARVPVEGSM